MGLTCPITTAWKTARKFLRSEACNFATMPASNNTRRNGHRAGAMVATSVSQTFTCCCCISTLGDTPSAPWTRMFPGCRSPCTKLSTNIWKRLYHSGLCQPSHPSITGIPAERVLGDSGLPVSRQGGGHFTKPLLRDAVKQEFGQEILIPISLGFHFMRRVSCHLAWPSPSDRSSCLYLSSARIIRAKIQSPVPDIPPCPQAVGNRTNIWIQIIPDLLVDHLGRPDSSNVPPMPEVMM